VTIVPPAVADASVLPTDHTQTSDEPLDRADVVAGSASTSSAVAAQQPEASVASVASEAAATSGAESKEAARSANAPTIDVETRHDRSRPLDLRDGTDALATDAGVGGGTEAIAITQAGIADSPTGDAVVKVARPLAQLPAVVSDLAQQARTESSPRRVVIPLDPPALGHVTVEIIVRADSVRVSLQHGDEAAFKALNAQRPAIEAALESSGLHLSGFDVSANNRQRASHMRTSARHFEALVEQVEPDGALRL
jgi:flagellar hook-length control protein FliK